jgi:hypothetical protein
MIEGYDDLGWSRSETWERILLQTESVEDGEHVVLSSRVGKFNWMGMRQTRILAISSAALYNCTPRKPYRVKRRIPLAKISSVTLSSLSPEFLIHVPEEYDYRFWSVILLFLKFESHKSRRSLEMILLLCSRHSRKGWDKRLKFLDC